MIAQAFSQKFYENLFADLQLDIHQAFETT